MPLENKMQGQRPTTGVMLVGHGTRDQQGTEQFFELSRYLAETLSPTPVAPCLLEFQEPTIAQAWDQLTQNGVTHIHVAPLLLFAAGHARHDIPGLVRECQVSTPDVTFNQCRPISRQSDLVRLVVNRIDEAVGTQLDLRETVLLMVGRGSRDPCATTDMKVLTEVVQHRFDFARASTAYYAMAKPSLVDALDDLGSDLAVRNVVVQPHLLFQGRLFQAIEREVGRASDEYSNTRFLVTRYLGPEPEIARAIAARITEI